MLAATLPTTVAFSNKNFAAAVWNNVHCTVCLSDYRGTERQKITLDISRRVSPEKFKQEIGRLSAAQRSSRLWPQLQPHGGGPAALRVRGVRLRGPGVHRSGPRRQVPHHERLQQAGGEAAPNRAGEGHGHTPAERYCELLIEGFNLSRSIYRRDARHL